MQIWPFKGDHLGDYAKSDCLNRSWRLCENSDPVILDQKVRLPKALVNSPKSMLMMMFIGHRRIGCWLLYTA